MSITARPPGAPGGLDGRRRRSFGHVPRGLPGPPFRHQDDGRRRRQGGDLGDRQRHPGRRVHGRPASRGRRRRGGRTGFFRVADGKIVEHWGSAGYPGAADPDRGDSVVGWGRSAGRHVASSAPARSCAGGSDDPAMLAEHKRLCACAHDAAFSQARSERPATRYIAADYVDRRDGHGQIKGVDGYKATVEDALRSSAFPDVVQARPRRSSPRATRSPRAGAPAGTHLGPVHGHPARPGSSFDCGHDDRAHRRRQAPRRLGCAGHARPAAATRRRPRRPWPRRSEATTDPARVIRPLIESRRPSPMSLEEEQRNKEIVTAFVKATNKLELDKLDDWSSRTTSSTSRSPASRPAARASSGPTRSSTSRSRISSSTSRTSSPRATWSSVAGSARPSTRAASWASRRPNKPVKWSGTRLFRMKDGQLVEGWINIDMLGHDAAARRHPVARRPARRRRRRATSPAPRRPARRTMR